MPEEQAPNQNSDVNRSESAHGHGEDRVSHESDDELMVYFTPVDYAALARQDREQRIARGADPESVIFQSEVGNHVPRQEGESPTDFAKRYSETMNAMIRRGVTILNDQCTGNVVPDTFHTANGRKFNLGPKSGATKGEYRQFSKWFSESSEKGQIHEVPEIFLKFEMPSVEES